LATTLTVMAALVVLLPATSASDAVSVWVPLGTVRVFQLTEYGAAVSSAPRFAPASLKLHAHDPDVCPPALAVDRPPRPRTVALPMGLVIATVGGLWCPPLLTMTLIAVLVVARARGIAGHRGEQVAAVRGRRSCPSAAHTVQRHPPSRHSSRRP
jgi:hypothetical protein